jgi:alpha-1,6-mannosyltransferase
VPVALCTAIGVWTQCGVVLFLVPNSVEHTVSSALGRYGWVESIPHIDALDQYFTHDAVVAADGQLGQFEVAGHGSYNVTSPWYLPEIPRPEQAARDTAESEIFAPTTTAAERTALLARYDVTLVLLTPGQPLPSGLPATLEAQQDGYRLYRVG